MWVYARLIDPTFHSEIPIGMYIGTRQNVRVACSRRMTQEKLLWFTSPRSREADASGPVSRPTPFSVLPNKRPLQKQAFLSIYGSQVLIRRSFLFSE